MHVAILMTTYNGEKYLKAQLDSIIKQTYKEWELFVCDDGSNDSTINILNEYKEKEPRIKEIFVNDSNRHGAYLNYFFLIRKMKFKYDYKNFDYYFYCDQDDVWLPDKMQIEIENLRLIENENSLPSLVYSDLELMDENEKSLGKKMSDVKEIELKNPLNIFFCPAYVWGTTMAHNRALWNLISVPEDISDITSHDNYISFYSVAFGSVGYINKPLVMYRRHTSNVSPLQRRYNLLSAIGRGIKSYKMIIEAHSRNMWNILYFIQNAPYKTEEMKSLESAINTGGTAALIYLKKRNISSYTNIYNRIAMKCILFFKLYKNSVCFKERKID